MKHLLLFTLIIISIKTYSQDTVRTSLIIFDNEDIDKVTQGDGEKSKKQKNAIKVNPLLFVRGEMPIYYERALNDYFSAEVAIGMTFKDYTENIFDEEDTYGENMEEKINGNISYKLGLRFYSGGVVMDGFYFAVEYAKRDYSRNLSFQHTHSNYDPFTSTSTTITTPYNFKEETNHSEIKLIVGSQEHYYWDNVFIDYYVGGGIDNYTEKKIKLDSDYTNGNDVYTLNKKESMAPRFYLGLKIGFMF